MPSNISIGDYIRIIYPDSLLTTSRPNPARKKKLFSFSWAVLDLMYVNGSLVSFHSLRITTDLAINGTGRSLPLGVSTSCKLTLTEDISQRSRRSSTKSKHAPANPSKPKNNVASTHR